MSPTALPPLPTHPSEYACVDLVNSRFTDHLGTGGSVDRLASTEWQAWFLDWHDLMPATTGGPPLDELRALRRDLRRILDKWSRDGELERRELRVLDRRTAAVAFRPRVVAAEGGVGLVPEPVRRDWTWVLGAIAESAVALLADGDPRRLKTCANPDCSWLFYDITVNRSRRFCSTTPCGSLIRVRRFRQAE